MASARKAVKFLVSPEAAASLDDTGFDWPADNPEYRTEMEHRFRETKTKSD
jgi:hypothetical protein